MGSAPGGTALLTISDGGLVTGGTSSLGRGGEATVIVTDAGSRLSSTGSMTVGELFGDHAGDGTLVIENGGAASAGNTRIGVGSSGAVTVRAGSELQAGTSLTIGEDTLSYTGISAAGDGALTIEAGGLAAADTILLGLNNGRASGSSGTITVLGTAASRGILETRSLMKGDEAATALFDGGILRATGSDTDDNPLLGSILGTFTVNIGDGGMFIDTQAYDVTAAVVLADDDPLAPGVLTKQGAGTLTLTEANSYSGDTMVTAGILRAGAINTFSAASGAIVAAGAAMDLAGFDQTIASLDNTGLVATNGAGPGTTLTVAGNYTGNGGIVALNTYLDGDTSPTDLLHVQGDMSGSGLLRITNVGGPGAQTTEGIKVIDVDGASGATFTLINPDYIFEGDPALVAGAYGYRLHRNGVATPDDGDWYLRSALLQTDPVPGPVPVPGTPPTGPLYQPGAPVYEVFANVLQGFNGIDTMQQRLGNRSWSTGTIDGGQAGVGMDDGSGIWARIVAGHMEVSPETTTTGSHYGTDIWQLQAGGDGLIHSDEAGRLNGGLWGRYGMISADVDSPHGDGSISTTGYGVGGSLTWQGETGFYLDAQGQLTWYDSDLHSRTAATDLAAGIGGFGYAAGLEAGQQVALGPNWSITPQAQLVYSEVNFDDFTDSFGARVSLLDGQSMIGRLGISADYENSWMDDGGETSRVHAYGIANLYHDFLSDSETDLAGVKFTSDPGSPWGGIGLGGTYNWGDDQYALHAETMLYTSLDNFGDSYEVSATLGFNVKF